VCSHQADSAAPSILMTVTIINHISITESNGSNEIKQKSEAS